jgi:hypothetical protein
MNWSRGNIGRAGSFKFQAVLPLRPSFDDGVAHFALRLRTLISSFGDCASLVLIAYRRRQGFLGCRKAYRLPMPTGRGSLFLR